MTRENFGVLIGAGATDDDVRNAIANAVNTLLAENDITGQNIAASDVMVETGSPDGMRDMSFAVILTLALQGAVTEIGKEAGKDGWEAVTYGASQVKEFVLDQYDELFTAYEVPLPVERPDDLDTNSAG